MNTELMTAEDCEDRYRDQCDKLRAAAERLSKAEMLSDRAAERLAIARAKELNSQVCSLERYVEANTKHGGDK